MARWEPNTRERLVRAALDLFTEQGYDNTTVSQIAERAGADQDHLLPALPRQAGGAVRRPGDAQPAARRRDRRGARPRPRRSRRSPRPSTPSPPPSPTTGASSGPGCCAVVAANRELRERAAFKRAALAEALAAALDKRGVPELTASLAAELGIGAFYRAFDQWADPAGGQTLTELTRQALDELRAATAALG